MEYRKAMMQGRLSSGLQADHGTRVHAVVRKSAKDHLALTMILAVKKSPTMITKRT